MKKETKASKIMKYIASNPTAKARDVAKALKVSVDSVYQATYLAKKKVNGRVVSVLTPNARMSKSLFSDPPERGRPSKLTEADFKKLPLPRIAYDDYGNVRLRMTQHLSSLDAVNSPPHYKVGGVETIDFIEAKKLGYNLGNVVKYVSRADYKGKLVEDLKKAQWYLNREIQAMEKAK
jgi:hypothetical protein